MTWLYCVKLESVPEGIAMLTDELLTYIFDGQPHPLTGTMTTWVSDSRRFADFVTTYDNKIRKKLRLMADDASALDLRLELETAYLLTQERRLNVVYEPKPEHVRCPDFEVTYTTSYTFMVEVTRIRPEPTLLTDTSTNPAIDERLADNVCSKLRQLLPHGSNVLLVGVDELHLTAADLRATMLHVQQRVEQNDPYYLQRHRFRDRADFFRHYQRLSEVLVRGAQAGETAVWVNPQAKHTLPSKARTAFYRSQSL